MRGLAEPDDGQMADTVNIMVPGAPNYPAPGMNGFGQVKGGLLRPGSIDQSQFQRLLATQNQNAQAQPTPGMTLNDYRKLAGLPPGPEAALAPEPQAPMSQGAMIDNIPTLTAEQFAALTGMSVTTEAPANPASFQPVTAPTPVMDHPSAAGAPMEMATPDRQADLAAKADAVTQQMAATPDAAPTHPAPDSAAEPAVDPDEDDPRVVWLDRVPDRDERRELMATGKRWRLRETPGANELFLGPDGKFGWDDFIDIINPLQHIPVVAQIYRAVTGDQAYAASQFAGAIPFGPLSAANAVLDTIIRAQTGRDAGTDIAAAILGVDNRTPEEANLHLVAAPANLADRNPAARPDTLLVADQPRRVYGNPNAGDHG